MWLGGLSVGRVGKGDREVAVEKQTNERGIEAYPSAG